MTDYESHHELDDELLSAYLDDELSPDERAAVDARLAEDSAAQQLLHQLRAVSQAVQAVPQEVVGHDLGEAVLRRVEHGRRTAATSGSATAGSTLDSANGAATQLDHSVPTFTIGRSRRSWMWASLAVAAGLMIMIFQPDRNANENLGEIAQRDHQLAREKTTRRQGGNGDLELRALSEPAASPTTNDLADLGAVAPAAPGGTTWSLDVGESLNGPMPAPSAPPADGLETGAGIPSASEPLAPGNSPTDEIADSRAYSDEARQTRTRTTTAGGEVSTSDSPVDALAAAKRSVTLEGDRGEAPGEAEATPEPAAASGGEQLVVVRVLAKPDAMRRKSFDRLLAINGIEVAAEEAKDDSGRPDASLPQNRFAEESELNRRVELNDQQPPAGGVEEDLVLVEAPPDVIASCLEGLNRDSQNYLGLAVEDTGANVTERGIEIETMADDSPAAKAAFAKKLGEVPDWTKYNRGTVPDLQESLAQDKDVSLNYRFNVQNDYYYSGRGGYGGGGGYGVAGGLGQLKQQNASSDKESLVDASRGHARRLSLWGTEPTQVGHQLDFGEIAPEEQATNKLSVRLRDVQRELKSPVQSGAETVQVLFVVSPGDEPAPSPAARNKAQ